MIEDAADAYTYYVCICGISESLFWDASLSFLKSVESNKHAYDKWLDFESHRKKRDS